MVGEASVVYFSSSHPWLSPLNRPRTAMLDGLPAVVLAWLFIILFINTAMNLKSEWALNTGVSKQKLRPVSEASWIIRCLVNIAPGSAMA
jgi:hypothetical protein